ncbi:hypothetical protein [Burkholderia anthina]|uniref:hypothetical protein n=1 Tax=Burkholderia anthina TaxID=179879 RepID=UPI0037C04983
MASAHTGMVRALEAGDADRAEAGAHQHAAQFNGRIMRYLDRNPPAQIPAAYPPDRAPSSRQADY